MVDMFVLVPPPAAGTEPQGTKYGVVELADLVLVNKADCELAAAAARRSVARLRSTMSASEPENMIFGIVWPTRPLI